MAITRMRETARTIDITPSWWLPPLTWGTPIEQWLQKARGIVNRLETFSRKSPAGHWFVGLFVGWTTDVHRVTAVIAVPEDMTDEAVEGQRASLVDHMNAEPPHGVPVDEAA